MYVCLCHAVTEHQIRDFVSAGAACIEEVSAMLGVGTCCGQCRDHAESVIAECRISGGCEFLPPSATLSA